LAKAASNQVDKNCPKSSSVYSVDSAGYVKVKEQELLHESYARVNTTAEDALEWQETNEPFFDPDDNPHPSGNYEWKLHDLITDKYGKQIGVFKKVESQADNEQIMDLDAAAGALNAPGNKDAVEIDDGKDLKTYDSEPGPRQCDISPGGETVALSDMLMAGGSTVSIHDPVCDKNKDISSLEWNNLDKGYEGPVHDPHAMVLGPDGLVPRDRANDLVFCGVMPPEYPAILPAGDIYALGLVATSLCTFDPRELEPEEIGELAATPSLRGVHWDEQPCDGDGRPAGPFVFDWTHPACQPWSRVYSRRLVAVMTSMTARDPARRPAAGVLLAVAKRELRGLRDGPGVAEAERAAIDRVLGGGGVEPGEQVD
jgi:hypothetical protein